MPRETNIDQLIEAITTQLAAGKRVRRSLPERGLVHIDRPLPFLCVYRQPVKHADVGTVELIEGQAAFLKSTAAPAAQSFLTSLVTKIAQTYSREFGAFLIIEVWSDVDDDLASQGNLEEERCPAFALSATPHSVLQPVLDVLQKGLKRFGSKRTATVEIESSAPAHPPGMRYLLTKPDAKQLSCHTIGICVRPIYRDPRAGQPYPEELRVVKRRLGQALNKAIFSFTLTATTSRPSHYHALGRRAVVKAVWDIDRRLMEVSRSFDLLLQVSPVNVAVAWKEFRRGRFEFQPIFFYRPMPVEPAELKRRLYKVPIERVEDSTLEGLFRDQLVDLDRQITMLMDIDTRRFLLGSQQVFGAPTVQILELAKQMLMQTPARRRGRAGRKLSATEFAQRAEQEFEYYRSQFPDFSASAEVRDDVSGLICSRGKLLIDETFEVSASRVDALLQHEVGTHLLTYFNGRAQPFQQLYGGLPGYDSLQEGLAVLTEYLAGGLDWARMRLLAARVVATAALVDGASFVDVFRIMTRDYELAQRTAYSIAWRTFRGGGLTKDWVYLQGLVWILEFLHKGGELDLLFVGKIAFDHIPLIRELCHRDVLKPPAMQPRCLEMPGASERLEQIRKGTTLLDLANEGRPK